MYTVGVITASDKGSKGEREDLSGKVICDIVTEAGYKVLKYMMVPDEKDELEKAMRHMADELHVNLILTTGGTGFSKRDVTPEATISVIEREAPGIAEAIRYNSLQITPKGMLSRGVSGIRGNTLIINMPGSPKAVRETLDYILSPVFHGIQILVGDDSECATPMTKA
ncbi:MogA/MoaB family molybdenum cofactor biosynthesis protein [Fusibacter ferrireducens]|uniref:MogA/MoaB family molybdenum cofactor biosynthesis protein n=1 Tax=Fusibacter ferrireducens TaxID=2785058 RepID=A0ABR9ZR33_9FIRM|nr:MogA/MoaB family molybdenum cofactor biosynthesis protein [Fusibacter ferrireducens]MBF4692912.1 MogA/MoaB family molybdenum cofactor biosynthesis protein [Fusibacter ferrireducens]